MSEMPPPKSSLNVLAIVAAISFIVSNLIIATQFQLQLIDILILVLAIVALIIAVYRAVLSTGSNKVLDIALVAIALIISLRFALPLLFDLQSVSTLLLYGAIILFLYIGVSGLVAFITAELTNPKAEPEPVEETEIEADLQDSAPEPSEEAEGDETSETIEGPEAPKS
ncbi:hypothetical protein [Ponticaulis sp.]|uniref:hypothetical protein n=1 Tax=Ponticaulis sp. TaxID=2020902 RepID=UPI000B744CD9|nr:hypothetical protein [Ponticaulis sp.]MAI89505.1 hypothetical protein [Ponticaulis sp.]OUY00540.1 MAG: hypothetical protein CBB65_03615 [Hyphomonadaceae bacterium TMED5]|tara:strand:- start:163095 stop:163601 length:507 start_codon:yes stop_codon:yes gene_type:complete